MTHDGAGIPSPRRGQHDSSRDSHAETGLRLIDEKGYADLIASQQKRLSQLQGCIEHYRSWAAQLQARFHLYSPDMARPARRVYIGNLPHGISDANLRDEIGQLLEKCGGCYNAGSPIVSCKMYPEKSYAFLEFRSVEEASNSMALDGVKLKDSYLKVRRPNNYDATTALMLGPTEPNPTLDLSCFEVVRTVVEDTPNKLFVGGLPCDWNEDQVKALLEPFGDLKAFNLVMDRETGNSKGYAFCEFMDVLVTDTAIQTLHGQTIGSKQLTVKRALAPAPYSFEILPFQ